ncbi:MAG: DNA-processing protein DprA [Paludibacter sp.]|nr:DNA-processing protein DprA [Paludibacter sp.]MDD4198526.1 DNA-processing protein DprA [Paludibacter sp.]MDD4427992.1 DNA-processing protein DprA [Paludibacter sp.]
MNHDLLKFRIGITLINGIGNNLAKNLIAYLGNEEAVFKEKKKNLSRIPGIGDTLAKGIVNHKEALLRAEQEIEFIQKNNIQCFYYADKNYPFRLKECPDAPLMLFAKCAHGLNDAKFVGIVGTRNATDYGKEICRNMASVLASVPNLVVISGLAYGIDVAAHKAALDFNVPTIGVIAHGLDAIYPSAHRSIAVRMLEKGGLVTEYLSKTNPDRQNFVQRNRIIAGLSDAVVVVESAQKGGALITAELANDYNRDVFAFPGRINDEWSKGCNALIKNNRASLIESPNDFIKQMGWDNFPSKTQQVQTELFTELSENELKIYTSVRKYPDGIHVNELSVVSAIPYSKLTALLLQMEFKALVKCFPGGIYKAIIPG